MTDVRLHIHRPDGFTYRRILRCQRCRARRRHLVTAFLWYSPIVTCCHCGAYRNDGILRPPRKGDSHVAAKARTLWATAHSRAEFTEWFRATWTEYESLQ